MVEGAGGRWVESHWDAAGTSMPGRVGWLASSSSAWLLAAAVGPAFERGDRFSSMMDFSSSLVDRRTRAKGRWNLWWCHSARRYPVSKHERPTAAAGRASESSSSGLGRWALKENLLAWKDGKADSFLPTSMGHRWKFRWLPSALLGGEGGVLRANCSSSSSKVQFCSVSSIVEVVGPSLVKSLRLTGST